MNKIKTANVYIRLRGKSVCLLYVYGDFSRRFTLGVTIEEGIEWSGSEPKFCIERGQGKAQAQHINTVLNTYLNKGRIIIQRWLLDDITPDYDKFCVLFKSKEQNEVNPNETLLIDFFDACVKRKTELEDISVSTRKIYGTVRKIILKVNPIIKLKELNNDFLLLCEKEQKDKDLRANTIGTRMKKIIAVVNDAVSDGILPKSPFVRVGRFSYEKTKKEGLKAAELAQLFALWQSNLLEPKKQETLRKFLIQCHTGLAFIDLHQLKASNFVDNDTAVVGHRAKNKRGKKQYGIAFQIPLCSKSLLLFGLPNALQLPEKTPLLNDYNKMLREIAAVVGIKTHLTSHLGRHTFAQMLLDDGVPIEISMKILGHSKMEMTENYSPIELKHIKSYLNGR